MRSRTRNPQTLILRALTAVGISPPKTTLLIAPRNAFLGRDELFENSNVKTEDAFAIIFTLEVEGT